MKAIIIISGFILFGIGVEMSNGLLAILGLAFLIMILSGDIQNYEHN